MQAINDAKATCDVAKGWRETNTGGCADPWKTTWTNLATKMTSMSLAFTNKNCARSCRGTPPAQWVDPGVIAIIAKRSCQPFQRGLDWKYDGGYCIQDCKDKHQPETTTQRADMIRLFTYCISMNPINLADFQIRTRLRILLVQTRRQASQGAFSNDRVVSWSIRGPISITRGSHPGWNIVRTPPPVTPGFQLGRLGCMCD